MTSISAVIQSIAETGLSQRCTYFKGTLEELNIDIERGNVSKDEWIFVRQKVGVIGTLLTDYLKSVKK